MVLFKLMIKIKLHLILSSVCASPSPVLATYLIVRRYRLKFIEATSVNTVQYPKSLLDNAVRFDIDIFAGSTVLAGNTIR